MLRGSSAVVGPAVALGDLPESAREQLGPRWLAALLGACQEVPTYLDKFYALQPGRPNGAKRLIVLLPAALRGQCDADWIGELADCATVVWQGGADWAGEELEAHEYAWAPAP